MLGSGRAALAGGAPRGSRMSPGAIDLGPAQNRRRFGR
jgi:hypothetical protein